MFCNEHVMTGACTANVAIACRFQPIGHFLTIQILTEIGAAQNQSQNSFEVANPLAAGVEATLLLGILGSCSHASSCMCLRRMSGMTARHVGPTSSLACTSPFCGSWCWETPSAERVHSERCA